MKYIQTWCYDLWYTWKYVRTSRRARSAFATANLDIEDAPLWYRDQVRSMERNINHISSMKWGD